MFLARDLRAELLHALGNVLGEAAEEAGLLEGEPQCDDAKV